MNYEVLFINGHDEPERRNFGDDKAAMEKFAAEVGGTMYENGVRLWN